MEEIFYVLVAAAAVLALPAFAIIGFLRSGKARTELAELTRRVAALEAQLAQRPVASEAPGSEAAVSEAPVSETVVAQAEERGPEPVPVAAQEEPVALQAAPLAAARAAKQSLEERIAGSWSVWLGGGTIALAAVFLVRYSIEEGLLGPAARILLGLAFGLALIAASIWLRRQVESGTPQGWLGKLGAPPPMIPPALAAAGVVALFASTYSAHAVHDLIAEVTAFVALAVISAVAMALALLHGPMVALLGQAAAFLVPALVPAVVDNHGGSAPTLFGYVLAVAGGCLALARYRGWRWSAWTALAGSMAWLMLWFLFTRQPTDGLWIAIFLVLLAALHLGPAIAPLADAEPRREPLLTRDRIPDLSILIVTGALFAVIRMADYATAPLVALALVMGLVAIDARWRERLDHVPGGAALIVIAAMAAWHVKQLVEPALQTESLFPGDVLTPSAWRFLGWSGGFGILAFAAAASLLWGAARPWRWAALGVVTPLALFAIGYWRVEDFTASMPWAAGALALGVAFVVLASLVARHRDAEGMALALGVLAIGVTASVSFGFTTLLRAGWLSVALALQLPALAWIAARLRVPELRWAAGMIAAATILRLLLNPWVFGYDLGTTPILNGLLYVYGVPALAFLAAAYMFAREGRDWVVLVLEIGTLAFATFLVTAEIRHWSGGGSLDGDPGGLLELALHAAAWLAIALALYERVELLDTPVMRWGWKILGVLGAIAAIGGSLILANPLDSLTAVGSWPLFNLLGLAYLVPALLAGRFAMTATSRGQTRLALAVGGAALVFGFVYLSLEVTRAFRGSVLSAAPLGDGEMYAYSAAWLLYGIALLALGLWLGLASLRYAALAMVGLTIIKVFLYDMAALAGFLRVLSFLGLGLSLLGLAWVYQRFVLGAVRKSVADAS